MFGFSLFCPCCASLHLPQAALSFAPKEKKQQNQNYSLKNLYSVLLSWVSPAFTVGWGQAG